MSLRPPRPPSASLNALAPSATSAEDDDNAFIAALSATSNSLLHILAPAVYPSPGSLDVLLIHSVVLVAYSAGEHVVIARGTDLATMRCLPQPALDVKRRSRAYKSVSMYEGSEVDLSGDIRGNQGGQQLVASDISDPENLNGIHRPHDRNEVSSSCDDPDQSSVIDAPLECPSCTAIAFRRNDGAIAAAFGPRIAVYEGWDEAAAFRGVLYDAKYILGDLTFPGSHVSALSWDADGKCLAAVGDAIAVWEILPNHSRAVHRRTSPLCSFHLVLCMTSEKLPVPCFGMGALSPDGGFLAAAPTYGQVGWVWSLPRSKMLYVSAHSLGKSYSQEVTVHSNSRASSGVEATGIAELSFGVSGVSAMEWKPRGGGNPALMTVDRNGTLRLWTKVLGSSAAVGGRDSQASSNSACHGDFQGRDVDLHMEEIARSPHVEPSSRAGAAFIHWGGGGGVADDESDAAATAASHPFLAEGAAPKPSRALHWIVRVAGGDARAWRVRGLDDHPRAQFTRLEPGSGEALFGFAGHDIDENEGGFENNFTDGMTPASLQGASINATKAIAPVPLTTSTKKRVGLVKSYAISNGERRLRSPEPPEPPNIAAAFVVLTRNGLPYVARYDLCPTQNASAICRARIGIGHRTPVCRFVQSARKPQECEPHSASWLVSLGRGGDALLWRVDASSTTREPLVLTAQLPGPHCAAACAPASIVAKIPDCSVALFAIDALSNCLHLFKYQLKVRPHSSSSVQSIERMTRIASHPLEKHVNETGSFIKHLVPFSLPVSAVGGGGDGCALLSVLSNGRLKCWVALVRSANDLSVIDEEIHFIGRRCGVVTCVDSSEELGTGQHLIALGSVDGCVRLYQLQSNATFGSDARNHQGFVASGNLGNCVSSVKLREVAFLGEKDGSEARVTQVCIMEGGERLALIREDGSLVLWERSYGSGTVWTVSLSIPALSAKVDSIERPLYYGGVSFGTLVTNRTVLYASRPGVGIEIYLKSHDKTWLLVKTISETSEFPFGPMTQTGNGAIVTTNRQVLLQFDGALGGNHSEQLSLTGNVARDILAHLLCGGRPWQTIAILEELARRTKQAREETQEANVESLRKIIVVPAPSLRLLLSNLEIAPSSSPAQRSSEAEPDLAEHGVWESSFDRILMGNERSTVKRNLFADLMAKSESQFVADNKLSNSKNKTDKLMREDENVLSILARTIHDDSAATFEQRERSCLSAMAAGAQRVQKIIMSLDEPGARFAIIAASILADTGDACVPLAAVASAFHSSATDALRNHFLSESSNTLTVQARNSAREQSSLWDLACRLGAGWWITTSSGVTDLLEKIARSEFNATRSADDAALWYIALGKVKALAVLYKAQQNLQMANFLERDFSEARHRVAAGKNAYVLVSRHRLQLATGFFILAGDVHGAVNLVRTRLKDDQLALLLSRLLFSEEEKLKLLQDMLSDPGGSDDSHRRGMLLWMLGRHEESLQAAADVVRYPSSECDVSADGPGTNGSMLAIPVALSMMHVTAATTRPPVRGTQAAQAALKSCREMALWTLPQDGCPSAAVKVGIDLLQDEQDVDLQDKKGTDADIVPDFASARRSNQNVPAFLASCRNQLKNTAVSLLSERAIVRSAESMSSKSSQRLSDAVQADVRDLCETSLGIDTSLAIGCIGSYDLSCTDYVDAACALALAVSNIARSDSIANQNMSARGTWQLEECCLRAASRCVCRSLCALSPLHRPSVSLAELGFLYSRVRASVQMVQAFVDSTNQAELAYLVDALKQAGLALRASVAYMRGDWSSILSVLQSCEKSDTLLTSISPRDCAQDEGSASNAITRADGHRRSNSILPRDTISLEGLRHIASNPAVLSISPSIGHKRRSRRAPSLALVDVDAASSALLIDGANDCTILHSSANDPLEFMRAHPSLNMALGSSAVSYLTRHQASGAASLVAKLLPLIEVTAGKPPKLVVSYSRLLEVSEAYEHLAADAVVGWFPLGRFGICPNTRQENVTSDIAASFVDLWCAMGNLPEYAPTLSEAATVAAAEVASAAALRADLADSEKPAQRRRRRLKRAGNSANPVSSAARSSADIFDTTSADSLFGAYPVRFSSSAKGPWSGRGQYSSLYRESHALFRTMCISSSDPPAVIVATPKGVQEIVPSSYITMPSGFRSHYFAARARERSQKPDYELQEGEHVAEREKMICLPRIADQAEDNDLFYHLETSFGEGPYIPLDLQKKTVSEDTSAKKCSKSFRHSLTNAHKAAVWRHQVEATALASHPLRRRFASGGTDGVVRIWEYGNPISLGALRGRNFGRVSSLKFSAYGNAIVSVHACGHVAIWQEPDNHLSTSMSKKGRHRDATVINAYHGRNASDAVFIDERHTIAAVGDHTCPLAVGHSLRVFDTREAHNTFTPSWSARVHGGGEARCLTLLEDRVRVVTGGIDGSLSVVDLRMSKSATAGGNVARVAELTAHESEVTCVATESPRGRALVSGCRNGDIKLWDARTLLQLDHIELAHAPTRHYWSGSGIGGLVGSYGTQAVLLTDRTLISCGGDGVVKTWGPGVYATSDLNVL